MADSPGYPTLLMFVGGEPDSPQADPLILGPLARLASFVIPPRMMLNFPTVPIPPDPTQPPWRIVKDHALCIEMVARVAGRHGQAVKVVDVNRAREEQDLVRQYIDEQDVLPVLVRLNDRSRLEGLESFSPGALERFIAPRSLRSTGRAQH